MINLACKEASHAFAWSVREKGRKDNIINSYDMPCLKNPLHISKKVLMCEWGSSPNTPLNGVLEKREKGIISSHYGSTQIHVLGICIVAYCSIAVIHQKYWIHHYCRWKVCVYHIWPTIQASCSFILLTIALAVIIYSSASKSSLDIRVEDGLWLATRVHQPTCWLTASVPPKREISSYNQINLS